MICTTAKFKRTEQFKTLVYKIKYDNKRTEETNKIVAQVLNTISTQLFCQPLIQFSIFFF